jgi:hypothetical protein
MTADTHLDQQIELCTRRIDDYKAKLASLSGDPDGRLARELLAKTIASEERLKEDLVAVRGRLRRRGWRDRGVRVTPAWLAFIAVVFMATLLAPHFMLLHH